MIRRLREQRRLTQVELARKAKLTQGYITMIETGVRKNPSLASRSASPRPSVSWSRSSWHDTVAGGAEASPARLGAAPVRTHHPRPDRGMADRTASPDPQLRRSLGRVLAAPRKAEATALARRRRGA